MTNDNKQIQNLLSTMMDRQAHQNFVKKIVNQNDDLDLVFFYSEPLVEIVKEKRQDKLVSCGSASLSTDNEFRRLVDILKNTYKEFKIIK